MFKKICLLILPLVCCLFIITVFLHGGSSTENRKIAETVKVKRAVAIESYPLTSEGEMAASPYLSKPVSYTKK